MKAKVKLTDIISGRSLTLIATLDNIEADEYFFNFCSISNYQRKRIENFFGIMAAYYTQVEIIKYY